MIDSIEGLPQYHSVYSAMEDSWTMMMVVVVALVVALVGQGATGAALQQHEHHRHERSRKHIARLQDTVDRLSLRQKIDHILLTNLQKTVQELLERNVPSKDAVDAASSSETLLSASVKAVEAEGRALSSLGERVSEVRGTLTKALEAEEHRDDIMQMRQELAYLRSVSKGVLSAAHNAVWKIVNVLSDAKYFGTAKGFMETRTKDKSYPSETTLTHFKDSSCPDNRILGNSLVEVHHSFYFT